MFTYMYTIIGSPSIPEECDGHEASKEDASRKSHLGLKNSAVGFGHSNNGAVRDFCDESKTTEESNSKTDVGQAADFRLPSVGLDEDLCYSCEEKVEQAINNRHVKRKQKDDWREEQHFKWPDHACAKDLGRSVNWSIAIVTAAKLWSVEFFLKA